MEEILGDRGDHLSPAGGGEVCEGGGDPASYDHKGAGLKKGNHKNVTECVEDPHDGSKKGPTCPSTST